jgi:septum site-determining protein MinD
MPNVISIVSGKGGCGKSLQTAVLGRALSREGERVLLLDLDIFVRGLTILLYDFIKRQSTKSQLTVSDLLGIYSKENDTKRQFQTLEIH